MRRHHRPRIDALRLAIRDRRRIGVFLVAVCLLLGVIAVRLGQLQLLQGAQWRQEALAQSRATQTLPAPRGTIFARDLRDLAISVPRDAVFADPTLVKDVRYYAQVLAPLLKVDEDRLVRLLSPQRVTVGHAQVWSRYSSLAVGIDHTIATEIDAMRFPGVYTRPEPQREYPDGSLAAAVIGRTKPGADGPVGASGLESQYESVLAGTPGLLEAERDAQGVEIPASQRRYVPARAGRDVVLTLDEGVQYQAERSLVDQVAAQQARRGMAVVMDLRTGDVLAMASVEGARNGKPARVASSLDANLPLTFIYNPGSVMKIVPISTALETRCVTPRSVFQVPYSTSNGPFTVVDDEHHPLQPMTPDDILVHSSNVGTTLIAQQCLRADTLDAALRRFGFGSKSGVGFPNEERGLLEPVDQYYDSGVASNAIGYTLLATPMQVLDAYATIARGGVPVQPRLVRGFVDASGKLTSAPVRTGPRVVSTATATEMQSFFDDVVRRGTGPCGSVEGYVIGGKTGTAQKHNGSGYSAADHVATFVGFGGGDSNALASIVVLDGPRDVYGARAAAPAFGEIMRAALVATRVPPATPTAGTPQWVSAAHFAQVNHYDCSVPHGAALAQLVAAHNAPPTTVPTTTTVPGAATTTVKSTRTTTTGTTTTGKGTTATTPAAGKHHPPTSAPGTATGLPPTTAPRRTTTSTLPPSPTSHP